MARGRRKTTAPVEKKSVFIVRSGSFKLKGVMYTKESGEFEAFQHEVPQAFRDVIVCVKDNSVVNVKAEKKYTITEVKATVKEKRAKDFVQKYQIVDEKANVISEPMTKEEAEKQVKEL